MRKSLLAAMSAVVLLSACGEGGSSSTGGGGTTSGGGSPTPTPSSPTPSPSPTYSTFAASLSGDKTFASACSALNYASSPFSTVPATPFGQGLTVGYTAATQTYAITGDGNSLSFGPADLVTGSVAGPARYSKAAAGGATDTLLINGGSQSYSRALSVLTRKFGSPITYYCVVGIPTLATDVPPIATYMFSPITIGGTLFDYSGLPASYNVGPSTMTFSVDLATQKVTASLHLIGVDGTGTQKDFGTFTGDGTIDATGAVNGVWSSAGQDVFGFFSGAFFGPQGKEVAISYNIQSRPSGTGGTGTVSAGYFYGAR